MAPSERRRRNVRIESRDQFLRDVECALFRHGRTPTDVDVTAAINHTIGIVSTFLYDASTTKQEAPMGRTFIYNRNDDDEDMRDVLQDGDRLVIPMSMMDSTDRRSRIEAAKRSTYAAGARLGLHNIKQPEHRITDGSGSGGAALNKPGYRIADGKPRDMTHYAAYDAEAQAAYKNVGADEQQQRDGDRSSDVMPVHDGLTHEQRMSRLYQLRDEELSNAWRNPFSCAGKGGHRK